MGKVEVVVGDITKQDVDAIVNAAHEALMGGGGVDGAIHRSAGPGLLRECMDLPEEEPGVRCHIGEAVVTSGHMLSAKWVVHTVAPRFVGSKSAGPFGPTYKATTTIGDDLRRCYRASVQASAIMGAKTIAFPSLGTGAHSIPVEMAAPIAVNAILDEMEVLPDLEIIRMVCFDERDMREYKSALEKALEAREV